MLNDSKIAAYTAILQEELLLATGCTEPIAVAYCAAKLREVLGGKPEKILAEISGISVCGAGTWNHQNDR